MNVDDVEAVTGLMAQTGELIASEFPKSITWCDGSSSPAAPRAKSRRAFMAATAPSCADFAEETMQHFIEHRLIDRKIDWREQRLSLAVIPDHARARRAGIQLPMSPGCGVRAPSARCRVLRDGDKPVPIVARITPLAETATELLERDLWSESTQSFVSARQGGVSRHTSRGGQLPDAAQPGPRHYRSSERAPGETATSAFNAIRGDIESIPLPPGYELEWGGEYESMKLANDMVISRFPIALSGDDYCDLDAVWQCAANAGHLDDRAAHMVGVFVGLFVTDLSFTFPRCSDC
ncbi:MAG: hypothetical protein CM15mP74_28860 [Halieaceae bacterium]|nr:MAG: hypothetical protein CM15mP74_28860 [Halieaceae bacterium]